MASLSVGSFSNPPATVSTTTTTTTTTDASSSKPIASSSSSLFDFPMPKDRKYMVLTRHIPQLARLIDAGILCAGKSFSKDLCKVIATYWADGRVVDRDGWRELFGVDIGEETPEVRDELSFEKFYNRFHAFNPIDVLEGVSPEKIRLVCESCLIPVVVPETVLHLESGKSENYCLNVLGILTSKPKNGHAATYDDTNTPALQQHGAIKLGPSRLRLMLEDVVARSKPWSCDSSDPLKQGQVQYLQALNARTGYGCLEEPDGLNQNTLVLIHYVVTGERFLGDKTGKEGRHTGCRTVNEVVIQGRSYKMASAYFRKTGDRGPVGGPAPAALVVHSSNDAHEHNAVAVLR